MGYNERKILYSKIEQKRNSNLIVYITGDRRNWETQIHQEVLNFLINHLDIIKNDDKKISLFLYTRGGNTLAAWSLVNLLRQFCNELEVIVPSKAHSAGTLICLGANSIVMTKQATLGPIDPNVNTPLNPHIPGQPENITFPVSVEAIKGYIELVKSEFGVNKSADLASIISSLNNKIHPLVLGEVYRARAQIKMLARKLLNQQIKDEKKKKIIIDFLCSESGSHDYTINRKEAKEDLGLNIEKPNDELYQIIKNIFDDIQNELELNSDFDPNSILGTSSNKPYQMKRALIESIRGGSHYFITEGNLSKIQQGVNVLINDQRIFEGWKYES
jgi:hypothetical protein